MNEQIDEKKTIYFVIAIIILIALGIMLIVHFNNKEMVTGNKNKKKKDTTTTTEVITTKETTTKKNKIAFSNRDNDDTVEINKSTIDSDSKLIFNYKLTNEIEDTDFIMARLLPVSNELMSNNILKLYDISLYNKDSILKSVNNSLINVKIPLTDDIKGYDEYQVVYIDENNTIRESLDTTISGDYIEFKTTHLSKYGIIAKKKEIDLTNIKLEIKVDDKIITDFNNVLVTNNSKIDISVIDLNKDYSVYYLLKNENELIDYKLYNNIDKKIFGFNNEKPIKYDLYVKVICGDKERIFEEGTFDVYDIIVTTDMINDTIDNNQSIVDESQEVQIGNVTNDDGTIYDYSNENKNQDIVIDNPIEEPITEPIEMEPDDEISSDDALVKVNGNVYIVKETDLTKLDLTGYLVIDTSENIKFNYENITNIYTITIKSKEFMLNGVKYTYSVENDNIIIEQIDDQNKTNNDIINRVLENKTINKNDNDELVISNKEEIDATITGE